MNGQQFEAGVFLMRQGLSRIKSGTERFLTVLDDLFEMEHLRLTIEHLTSQIDAIPYSILTAKTAEEKTELRILEKTLSAKRAEFEARVTALSSEVAERRSKNVHA